MTESEYPDHFAGLFGELDADSRSSLAQPSPLPENGAVAKIEPAGFTSRREMREAGVSRAVFGEGRRLSERGA